MKIYTTYLYKLKDIPDNTVKLFVARDLKPHISNSLEKYNCIHTPQVAPSRELREEYKQGYIDYDEFIKKYAEEERNLDKQDILDFIKLINQNKDLYLICYEKDSNTCHRKVLASVITNILTNIFKEEIVYEGEMK